MSLDYIILEYSVRIMNIYRKNFNLQEKDYKDFVFNQNSR